MAIPERSAQRSASATFRVKWWACCPPTSTSPVEAPCGRSGAPTSVSVAPNPAIFIPAALDITKFQWNGNYGNWSTLGRLNPGVTLAQASAQLNTIQAQILGDPSWPADRRAGALGAWVQPMREAIVGGSRTALWFLMASVLSLMLIACLNLANAQLGRALTRSRESAVRAALGAAKWSLIWNVLAENLLLAENKGFDTTEVAVAEVRLTPQSYGTDQSRVSFDDAVLTNLRTIPGVEAAAMVSAMPLGGESWIERAQRVDKPELEYPLINF